MKTVQVHLIIWTSLVPYYFYISYQESHTEDDDKVKEKGGNKVPFQNTCFGVVINAAHARSPDKIKQLLNSIFSESRAINCIYWWINLRVVLTKIYADFTLRMP